MSDQWQSNALWPQDCYLGEYGDSVSMDTHRTLDGAIAVCVALEDEGFGGQGEFQPIKTWWNKIDDGNPILEEIRKNLKINKEEK